MTFFKSFKDIKAASIIFEKLFCGDTHILRCI